VLRNLARAVALFDQACLEGEVEGCYELGLLYRSGRGVSADEARARQLLQGACDAGMARACAGVDPTQ
jgi:TPR repeat protein